MRTIQCTRWPGFRIIPACAGNAARRSSDCVPARDHPRVCGECTPALFAGAGDSGSSPRVRGMLRGRLHRHQPDGIIPACAGNAAPANRGPRSREDHPRVCGECVRVRRLPSRVHGSSPRVRGMPRRAPAQVRRDRIIPACAGNASYASWAIAAGQDHPRVCGECAGAPRQPRTPLGSSPRVRGMRMGRVAHARANRIIPACAGNASAEAASLTRNRDHPRVCGECV